MTLASQPRHETQGSDETVLDNGQVLHLGTETLPNTTVKIKVNKELSEIIKY